MNYAEIEQKLRVMQPRSKLYELIKAEMQARGHWKAAARGAAFKTGYDPRRSNEISQGPSA